MTGLPPALRPLWPHFKRVHRRISFALGLVYRAISPALGSAGAPRGAYPRSHDAARAEGDKIRWTSVGAAYQVERGVPSGQPAAHRVFASGARVGIPDRYVMEVDGGRVVGDFGALVTPRGMLDFQTSNYFGISHWREHPIYLRPTLGVRRHVPGRVLSLTSPGVATNYYHFLYDAIGRLEIVESSGVGTDFDAVVVPFAFGYQKQLLDMVGITGELIQLERGQHVSADRLVVPSTPNSAVVAPRETVAWLRAKLLPSEAADVGSERIYITRGAAKGSRRYLQEDELWPQLEDRGFRRVDPGAFPVREQIEMFSRAEIVVSPHGAGLTNITFAPPGVKVLEFFAPAYVHLGLWGICAVLDRVDYRYLVGDDPRPRRERLPRPFDDVSLAPRTIVNTVDQMLASH